MNTFPAGGRAILDRLFAKHQNLALGSDDDRRALTKMMAEQFAFTFGPRWGTKRAAGPQSKDTLALLLSDGAFDMWDWQNGSTKQIQVQDGAAPTFQHVADQVFISVTPVNHLGEPEQPDDAEPDEDEPTNPTLLETLTALALQLQEIPKALQAQADLLTAMSVALAQIRDRQEDGLTGTFLGYRITVKPPTKKGNGQG